MIQKYFILLYKTTIGLTSKRCYSLSLRREQKALLN
tara:strand:+ start:639 stop:746 length:108 start_codon:yes stop_codon:yes gene_type:complete